MWDDPEDRNYYVARRNGKGTRPWGLPMWLWLVLSVAVLLGLGLELTR